MDSKNVFVTSGSVSVVLLADNSSATSINDGGKCLSSWEAICWESPVKMTDLGDFSLKEVRMSPLLQG